MSETILEKDKPILDLESLVSSINTGMEVLGISDEKVKLDEVFLENVEFDLITLFKLKDKLNIKFAET